MPWTGSSFAAKHNKSLSGKKASKAASIATAMVDRGVSDGEAIATANSRVKHMTAGKSAKQRTGKSKSWVG